MTGGFPFRLWPARGVRRARIGLTIAFLLLMTGGGVGYWYIRWGEPQPLNHRLSIVVLPFTNLSNEPEQEYFAGGIEGPLGKEMVTPAAERKAVAHLRAAFGMSERRACMAQRGRSAKG